MIIRAAHFTVLLVLWLSTPAFANRDCRDLFLSSQDAALLDPSIPRLVTSFAPYGNVRESKVETDGTPEIALADIMGDGQRFERVLRRVFARRGTELLPDELATLNTYIERFGGHALSVGNYGTIDSVPAIDAVHFPRNIKDPVVNISIKSSTSRDRTNAFNFLNGALTKARASLQTNYGHFELTRILGRRVNEAEDLFQILGFTEAGDRRVILLLDLSLERTQTPKLERAGDVPKYRLAKNEAATDVLLTVNDSRVSASENASHNRVNLSALRRDIRAASKHTSNRRVAYREGAEFSEYRIMFADANVIVTGKDILLEPLD